MENSFFEDDGFGDLLNENINNENHLPSEDEAEEPTEQAVKVEPKKKIVRNPRNRLTVDLLRGHRGIHTIENYFKDIKYHGKGHEKEDLDQIMRRLQHWAHRLYPSYKFDDVIATIERLGRKKPLQVHMNRYRMGMLESVQNTEEKVLENDNDEPERMEEPFDEFDALLDEQIAISRQDPKTPRATSNPAVAASKNFGKMRMDDDFSDFQPLPPSQPSPKNLTDEQIARMEENRRIAREKLKAKMTRLNITADYNANAAL